MVTPSRSRCTCCPHDAVPGGARAVDALPRYPAPMTDQPALPHTPAIAALEAAGVPFRVVRTEIARSAEESAAFQGIPVGSLLRSILVRRAADDFFFVLVPGGRRFNWPALRALLGTNRLTLPTEEEAKAETGYVRGAITPFGARRPWPVIADASIERPGGRGDRRRRAWRERAPGAGGPGPGDGRPGRGHHDPGARVPEPTAEAVRTRNRRGPARSRPGIAAEPAPEPAPEG